LGRERNTEKKGKKVTLYFVETYGGENRERGSLEKKEKPHQKDQKLDGSTFLRGTEGGKKLEGRGGRGMAEEEKKGGMATSRQK